MVPGWSMASSRERPMPLSEMVTVRAALSKAMRIFQFGIVAVQSAIVQRLEAATCRKRRKR